jgi:hypothetical protein
MKIYALLMAPILIVGFSTAGYCWDDDDGYDASKYRPQTSMQTFYQTGNATANVLQMGAEYCMVNKNYKEAMNLSKQAMSKDKNDIDIRMTYAKAMEGVMEGQDEKDPELFNKCVKQWLIVYRNTVGDEKGLSFHGISLPGMQKRYEDEERGIPAKQHLFELCKTLPGQKETDAKFLKRVLKPAEEEVSGKVLADDETPTKGGAKPNAKIAAKEKAAKDKIKYAFDDLPAP